MDRGRMGGRRSQRGAEARQRQENPESDEVLKVVGPFGGWVCAHIDSDVRVDVDTRTFVARHYEQTSASRRFQGDRCKKHRLPGNAQDVHPVLGHLIIGRLVGTTGNHIWFYSA